MFLVGLTGGIATGKSTVADMFVQLGCPLVDADKIAREVVQPGCAAWQEIKRRFGDEVIGEEGHLRRDVLARIIFRDGEKRKLLNGITHPQILKTMLWRLLGFVSTGEQFVLLDVPLLYETKKVLPYVFYSVVVFCDEKTQRSRLRERNDYTIDEAQRRINAQLPLDEKCRRATYVIDNSGSTEETWVQVREVHAKLLGCKAHWVVRFILGLAAFVTLVLTFWGVQTTMRWLA